MSGPVDVVLERLEHVKRRGAGWQARCPAHEDRNPSLSVDVGDDGRALVKCHAGCELDAILAALGLERRDLFPQDDRRASANGDAGENWTPHGPAVAFYPYHDENGRELYQVARTADKQFPVRRRDSSSRTGWRWSIRGVRRVLFHLPRVLEAVAAGETIYITEGEKDVGALERLGLVATCNPGGAGNWTDPGYADALAGAKRVVVLADDDTPGRKHAEQVARALAGRVDELKVVELYPPGETGRDVSDWIAEAFHAEYELEELVERTPVYTPPTAESANQDTQGADVVVWFESAADLLAEPDPGPTPFLVDELVVDGGIVAVVGAPKARKTWTLLDLAIAVATGELALGRFGIARPGPVLLILEESGRAALHRRLDMLVRGRAVEPGRLVELYFAANRRVRLNDAEWQRRLLDAAASRDWRLIAFDPLARIKGAAVDENVQREIGPVLDFVRDLRDVRGSTVGYVHHTPHDGARQRGSSDLEAYWESKLTLANDHGSRTLRAEHREAESAGPFVMSFGFDATTRTVRMRAFDGELEQRVRDYLDEHPDASANEVDDNVDGNRKRILELVKQYREGGSESPEPPGTTLFGSDVGGGSFRGAYEAPGTTPADLGTASGSESQNHPESEGES